MRGTAYGVGVGPGDAEYMTLKAIRLIKENDVIAVPGKEAKESVAYKIAVQNVPELSEKELVPIYIPMIKDKALIEKEHIKGANIIKEYLNKGKNVVYITLGDPTIYCSFSYLQHILERDGYNVELVSGITSFCAAAARLNLPLTEWDEPLHIVPAAHKANFPFDQPGNYVLMKSASYMEKIKDLLRKSNLSVSAVTNCGMPGEKVYKNVDDIPDDAGYFSLIIAKGSTDFQV